MAKYVYPAVFTQEDNGQCSVNFPDIKNCYTGGDSIADAMEMAEDVLCLTLYNLEKANKSIPHPSDLQTVSAVGNDFVSLVHCDTEFYKRYFENKSIKKTLTIPGWLNERAEQENINFSGVLQDALKIKLHLQ